MEQKPIEISKSILSAFNLGVWMRQQKGQAGNASEVTRELGDMIYWNMNKEYEGYPLDLLKANVEYLSQIALLGYILPGVSLYDEELKNRLLSLIEAKASGLNQEPINKHLDSLLLI